MIPEVVLDVDEVVFPWAKQFIRFLRENFDNYYLSEAGIMRSIVDVGYKKIRNWNFYEQFGMTRTVFLFLYHEYLLSDMAYDTKPCAGVGSFYQKVSNHAIIQYCTARPTFSSKGLIGWFKKNKMRFNSLNMISNDGNKIAASFYHDGTAFPRWWQCKLDFYKDVKPTVVVDDKPQYITGALQAGVPHVYLIKIGHNEGFAQRSGDEITVCTTLGEVADDLINKGVV